MKKTLLLTLLTLSIASANAASLHEREASKPQTLTERAEWKEALEQEVTSCDGSGCGRDKGPKGIVQKGSKKSSPIACDCCGGKDSSKGPKASVAPVGVYTSHPGIIYYPIAVSSTGSEVTLIDGSVWTIRNWDRGQTLNWLATDEIVILPNTSFFSLYDYKLLNRVTGSEVSANLTQAPLLGAAYTRQVTGFNDNYNYVYLTDGSVWAISPYDITLYKTWMIGDILLIGANQGWDSNVRPNVLINATHQSYIRANCIQ